MRRNVTYSYKLKLCKENGEVLNSHCECPAGKGTCKHLAAVLIMFSDFVSGNNPNVQMTCTEILQTFHKPKKQYSGTPLKAEDLPGNKQTNEFQDPRPPALRNCANYIDHVRNTVFNYCSNTSKDLPIRCIWGKADTQSAGRDHDYLPRSLLEQWVDNAKHISPEQIVTIEQRTRSQADNHTWREQRLWRVTASRFGEICKLTARRNMNKLCKSFMTSSNLKSKPIILGKQYEETARKKFEAETGLTVQRCGLYICHQKPYLACTPDGVISDTSIIEIKCPYSGRDMFIKPGKLFPFLEYDSQAESCSATVLLHPANTRRFIRSSSPPGNQYNSGSRTTPPASSKITTPAAMSQTCIPCSIISGTLDVPPSKLPLRKREHKRELNRKHARTHRRKRKIDTNYIEGQNDREEAMLEQEPSTSQEHEISSTTDIRTPLAIKMPFSSYQKSSRESRGRKRVSRALAKQYRTNETLRDQNEDLQRKLNSARKKLYRLNRSNWQPNSHLHLKVNQKVYCAKQALT
ncbi:EXO-like protein [Mya arenaria]|uniref:EXO-like protein n=1 Tax=Mya arenaria TaxID=6604 RepID=A0ABY7EU67_MYAAR|nr:EXO-like protein [Mya arenaria]